MKRERKRGGIEEQEGEEGREAEFESESFATHFTCLIPGCDFET